MEHTGFPSDETLAAFIDGRLDEETRKRVVEHLGECSECRDVWLGGREWTRDVSQTTTDSARTGVRKPVYWWMAVAAAAAIVVVSMPGRRWYLNYKSNPDMNALVSAGNELHERSIEGRLSGGLAYKPMRQRLRGGNPSDREGDNWKILAIAARNASDAPSQATAESLHTLGNALLLVGRGRDGVEALESAIKKETGQTSVTAAIAASRDAALLNDLSAAFAESSIASHSSADINSAVYASDRSWTLRPAPEAAWNRAIATELKGPVSAARAAWRDYIRIDPNSDWTREALIRLERLDDQLPVPR